ncbi:MAG TPA: hypothetical protein VFF24_13700 [Acidimicrobiia bacterium]|nr:hypothetical protein [Acidimicrobiia bacterium]
MLPSVEIRSTWRLRLATASVELLPWDGRRTELALRLERRWLLSADRYEQVAAAGLALLEAELAAERVLQHA